MKAVVAVQANEPRSILTRNIAWAYAAVLVVMAVGQLFSFEKFLPLIQSYLLPGGDRMGLLIAGAIVATEVLAVPFLLRMPLSPLMRWFSMICGWLAAGLWLGLALITLTSTNALNNSGMLGTKFAIPAGIAQLIVSIIMVVLAIWSATGLWPVRASHKK